MEFFNKKEEVIDIQLTQFGKNLLSRGFFKPVYYQMFDDDVMYNTETAGFKEHQNDAESRILEETPKLKTLYLTTGVETKYYIEEEKIISGELARYETVRPRAEPLIQEKILLYPLHSSEKNNQAAPRFSLTSHFLDFKKDVYFLSLTGSGVQKNIPQLDLAPAYKFKRVESEKEEESSMIDDETFIDLLSREVTFADNTKIKMTSEDIVLDLEEYNAFYGLDNFTVELYEIEEAIGADEIESLRKIEKLEEINTLFHIKTDEHVDKIHIPTGKNRNYYRRGEET